MEPWPLPMSHQGLCQLRCPAQGVAPSTGKVTAQIPPAGNLKTILPGGRPPPTRLGYRQKCLGWEREWNQPLNTTILTPSVTHLTRAGTDWRPPAGTVFPVSKGNCLFPLQKPALVTWNCAEVKQVSSKFPPARLLWEFLSKVARGHLVGKGQPEHGNLLRETGASLVRPKGRQKIPFPWYLWREREAGEGGSPLQRVILLIS